MSEDTSPGMIPSRQPLPVELMDQIFAELGTNDWKSLKACSLLSHTFLFIARKHLFRNVAIALEPDRSNNGEHVGNEKHVSSSQFLSFLASDAHVASLISSMHIHHPSNGIDASASDWYAPSRNLADILPRLTHLHHLSICSSFLSDWTMIDDNLREVLIRFHQIPTLQHLELHHIGLSQDELLALTGIPRLTLVGLYSKPGFTTSSTTAADEDTASRADTTSLNCLSITLKDSETATHMFIVARAAHTSLKSLEWLSSPYHESQDTCIDKIDLQSLPFLSLLTVCVPLDGSSLSELASLFQYVGEESKLEVIEIICDYQNLPNEDTISAWCWESLDSALTSPIYTALREVKISAKKMILPKTRPSRDHEVHCREASSVFRDWLPTVRGRGFILGI